MRLQIKCPAHGRHSITYRYYYVIYCHFSRSYRIHSSLGNNEEGVGVGGPPMLDAGKGVPD